MSDWTLFSNHGHVLVCLARDPGARLRNVAEAVGITERAVQKIVRDLQDGGMISVSKQGRRNQYRLHRKVGLRHSLESERNIGSLMDFVVGNVKPVATSTRQVAAKPSVAKVARNSEVVKAPVVVEPTVVEAKPVAAKPAEVEIEPVVAKPTGAKKKSQAAPKKTSEAAKSAAKKKELDKAKAISDIEKQQGSLF